MNLVPVRFFPGNRTSRIVVYAALVAAGSLAGLTWNINRDGIAAPYSDPIAKIRAQDEAIYVNSAITMVRDRDWLTPKVMGRLFFLKPPLLIWMSALSIRLFGLSLFSVRLPALLAGTLGIGVVFVWCASLRSVVSAILAAALLFLDPLWQTLSRLSYTDVLASSFSALALLGVAFDPGLAKRSTRILFGFSVAAAVLAKSIAGLLPVGALFLYCFLTRRKADHRFRLAIQATLIAAAVIAPWHIYELAVHPQWFWAEYVREQLLHIGANGGYDGVFHRSVLFWIERLVQLDPALTLFAVFGFIGAWRSRCESSLLVFCWILVTSGALLAYQSRNLPYLVLLLPALCVLGGLAGPDFLDRKPVVTAVAVAILFLAKIGSMGATWSWRPAAPPLDAARSMRAYYRMHRGAQLIVVDPDDQFYAATLPLASLRYCFLDPSGSIDRIIPYYQTLGITLTVDQFIALPNLMAQFEQQFRSWHADGSTAIGSAITLTSPSEVALLVRAEPGSDFYLPSRWAPPGDASHDRVPCSPTRVFLLSRTAKRPSLPLASIPDRW